MDVPAARDPDQVRSEQADDRDPGGSEPRHPPADEDGDGEHGDPPGGEDQLPGQVGQGNPDSREPRGVSEHLGCIRIR